jgi:hypothetical protein
MTAAGKKSTRPLKTGEAAIFRRPSKTAKDTIVEIVDKAGRIIGRLLTPEEVEYFRAQAAEIAEQRRRLDRALRGERRGFSPPRSKPEQATPKKEDGRVVTRIKQELLPELYPPDGLVPEHVNTETVHAGVAAIAEKRGWKTTPSYDSVARALGRRKD